VTARFTYPSLNALLVAGAVLLPSPGSAAVSAPVSQISSALTQPNVPAYFRVVGTGGANKAYDVLVSLSNVPCPGKYKFRSTVDSLLDSGSTTYTSTIKISKMRVQGARIKCGRPLASSIGALGARVDFDGIGSVTADQHIGIDAGRRRASGWRGTMTLDSILCGPASPRRGRYSFVATFRGEQATVVLSYVFEVINPTSSGDKVPCVA
jgi:hypothetical protein